MSAHLFSHSFEVDSESTPEYYFFKTINERKPNDESYRVKMLDNQVVPVPDKPGHFIDADTSLNVQFDKKYRNELGVIFASQVVNPVVKSNKISYYNTSSEVSDGTFKQSTYWVLSGPNKNAPDEVMQAYEAYTEGKPSRSTSTASVSKKRKPATAKSLISQLLKKFPCPTVAKNGFFVEESTWMDIIWATSKKKNLLLAGPSGCGKTEIVNAVSQCFSKIVHHYDMGVMLDPVPYLIGSKQIENGTTFFDQAKFVTDIQTDCIINLDEISRTIHQTGNILLPLLDARRELQLVTASSKEERTVKVNDETIFFATANLGSDYSGTNDLDRALQDRFKILYLDFPNIEAETALLVNRYKIKEAEAEKISNTAWDIRDSFRNGSLSAEVSTRYTLMAGEKVADGYDLVDAMKSTFTSLYREKYEKEAVMDIISRR